MEAPRTARPGLGWCLCWALLGAGAGAGSGPLGGLLLGQEEPEGPFPAETPSAAVWEDPRRARQDLSGEPPAAAALLRLGGARDAAEEGRRAPRPSLEEAQAPRRSPDGDRGGEGRGGRGGGGRGKREAEGPRRAKRGFTYPGTLWCGAGNIAASYDELGEHREADRCCREHDHCQHVIHPFTYKYGYRNFRWHTISHCDCDHQLKACLRSVNDTASRVVGQAFFNVIQVPCFTFAYKEQCVQPYLYMWCKNYSTVAVAVIQKPVLYEYGGELIDGPVTRRTAAAAATPSTTVAPRGSPATTESAKGPGFTAKPDLQPKKAWKEKTRKGRKKGPKKGRKGKGPRKNTLGKTRVSPGPGATVPPKQLEVPEVGKADLEGRAGFPDPGEGDPFNAVLSDDPGGGTGLEAAEEDGGTRAQGKAVSGTSPPAEPFGRKRKGRRQQASGRPASERRRDSRGRGI